MNCLALFLFFLVLCTPAQASIYLGDINTADKTTIAGANIHAADKLTLNTGSLDVRSVQDSTSSKSSSKGISMSDSGSGSVNGAISRSSSKETLLTSITGGEVDINVDGATTVTGALIAAVDADGNDNGQLSLKTETLTVSSLNNTKDNKSMSANVSAGGTASVDASADNAHSKTKTLATLGSGNIEVANVDDSNTTMLNRDITDNEVDIYDIESHKGIKGSLDTRFLTEEGRAKVEQELKDTGKNMQEVAQGLPSANSDNPIIAAIGEALDTISGYTGGIIPSEGLNGGLLGNIPVMLGDDDINHKVIQVSKENKEGFIPIEESDFYKNASEENKTAIKGLYVSKEPVTITKDNATYQNFTNGMLNSEGDAIKNGKDQTGNPSDFTVNYNPTHGIVGDGLESGVDKLGGTTGIAKQTGYFYKVVTDERGENGANFANHSQGNLLTNSGLKNQQQIGGFKSTNATVSSFGSPVNTTEMESTVEGAGFTYSGAYTKPGDFVGEGLGGNKGQNEQMSTVDRIKSIKDAPKLFTDKSPHSTYICEDHNGAAANCGDRP